MSARELILHIGTEKTGTTTVQDFLTLNRERLRRDGFQVPVSLGDHSHRRLPVLANDDDFVDGFILREGIAEPGPRAMARERWREAFRQELARSDAPRWIISSEHLSSRLFRPQEMARLHELIAPNFSTIRILVYLRNPVDAAVSLLSTTVKVGSTTPNLPPPPTVADACSDRSWPSVCHHQETLERWIGTFGDRLSVRLFSPETLVGGDILADFCDATGIVMDESFIVPRRNNESLSRTGIALLAAVNERIPAFVGDAPSAIRLDLVDRFEKHLSQQARYRPSESEIAAYEAAFRDSNEWVRRRYFPERERLFPETPAPGPEEGHAIDAVADLVAELWTERVEYRARARRIVNVDALRGRGLLSRLARPFKRRGIL